MFSWCQSHLKYRNFGTPKQEVSIFWYPKAASSSKAEKQHSRKVASQQLSSQAGAKQHSRKVASQELSSQAGAKMPRYKDFFPRARHFVHFLASQGLQGITKINHFCIQIPTWPHLTITLYLLYKGYVFMMLKPPKI